MAYNIHISGQPPFDVATTEGADRLITYCAEQQKLLTKPFGFERFHNNLPRSAREKKKISVLYTKFLQLFHNVSPQSVNLIDKTDFEVWFHHCNSVLEKVCHDHDYDRLWKESGELEKHNQSVIEINVLICQHYKAIPLAFDTKFFETLAKFIASRAVPDVPCPTISSIVTVLVSNAALINVKTHDELKSVEKFWKQVESSGLLLQFIRCATQRRRDSFNLDGCFGNLIQCMSLIKKKFKPGQPSGDGLISILAGEDCCTYDPDPKIMKHIKSIVKLAKMSNEPVKSSELGSVYRTCRYCGNNDSSLEFQKSLMQCARCKTAYYCSKECQVKDWKEHRKVCEDFSNKREEKDMDTLRNCLCAFLENNYIDIMSALLDKMDETGLPKEDLVLYVNFDSDFNGRIAALESIKGIAIVDIHSLLEGKNEGNMIAEDIIGQNNPVLKQHYDRMTTNHILCLSHNALQSVVTKVSMRDPVTDKQIYSTAALDAVRKARDNGDFTDASCIYNGTTLLCMKFAFSSSLGQEQ